jgi:hypothetical protein
MVDRLGMQIGYLWCYFDIGHRLLVDDATQGVYEPPFLLSRLTLDLCWILLALYWLAVVKLVVAWLLIIVVVSCYQDTLVNLCVWIKKKLMLRWKLFSELKATEFILKGQVRWYVVQVFKLVEFHLLCRVVVGKIRDLIIRTLILFLSQWVRGRLQIWIMISSFGSVSSPDISGLTMVRISGWALLIAPTISIY